MLVDKLLHYIKVYIPKHYGDHRYLIIFTQEIKNLRMIIVSNTYTVLMTFLFVDGQLFLIKFSIGNYR